MGQGFLECVLWRGDVTQFDGRTIFMDGRAKTYGWHVCLNGDDGTRGVAFVHDEAHQPGGGQRHTRNQASHQRAAALAGKTIEMHAANGGGLRCFEKGLQAIALMLVSAPSPRRNGRRFAILVNPQTIMPRASAGL